jgi:putative spermidine/putrescine transport system permease protein
MSATDAPMGSNVQKNVSAFFWRRPSALGLALSAPPVLWLGVFYLCALIALFFSAFWQVDSMTGALKHEWTLSNFQQLIHSDVYQRIALRTIGMAIVVTITDAILALPLAYYIVRIAGPRLRAVLFMLVLVPLWSSILARVYAWRLILAHDGVANWALGLMGLPPGAIGYSYWALWIVFSYLWLPFVILPTAAALERVPGNLLEASADLGGNDWRTFLRVTLPLAAPGLLAGTISSFSLTLGDFVTPMLVGGAGSDFIGNAVYNAVGVANNTPFAAAFATVPLIVTGVYLFAMRRLGAAD